MEELTNTLSGRPCITATFPEPFAPGCPRHSSELPPSASPRLDTPPHTVTVSDQDVFRTRGWNTNSSVHSHEPESTPDQAFKHPQTEDAAGGRVTVMSPPTTDRPMTSAQVAITPPLEATGPTRREKPPPFHRLFDKTPESLFHQQILRCAVTDPPGASRTDSAIAAPQRGHGVTAPQTPLNRGFPVSTFAQLPVMAPYSSHQYPPQEQR